MAICLDYQPLTQKRSIVISPGTQLLFVLAFMAALASKVYVSNSVTELGYKLAEEKKARISLDLERRELELQLSVLLRPDRLAQKAKDRLGLNALDPAQARRIRY